MACMREHELFLFAGPSAGELWPTQLTHGSVISFAKTQPDEASSKTTWRMATALEHMNALGWRVYGESKIFPVTKMVQVMKNLSLTPSQIKTLAGNSMHLRTQLAFMLYCLAQIIKKQPHAASSLRSCASWMDDEDQ